LDVLVQKVDRDPVDIKPSALVSLTCLVSFCRPIRSTLVRIFGLQITFFDQFFQFYISHGDDAFTFRVPPGIFRSSKSIGSEEFVKFISRKNAAPHTLKEYEEACYNFMGRLTFTWMEAKNEGILCDHFTNQMEKEFGWFLQIQNIHQYITKRCLQQLVLQIDGTKVPCSTCLGVLQEPFLHTSKTLGFFLDQTHFDPKWKGCHRGGMQGFNLGLEGRRVIFINLDMQSFNGIFGLLCRNFPLTLPQLRYLNYLEEIFCSVGAFCYVP